MTVSYSSDLIILLFIILISSLAASTSRLSNWVSSAQKKWVTVKFNTQLLNCIFLIFCLTILIIIQALIVWTEINFLNYQLLSLMIEFDLRFEFDWSVNLCEHLKESFSQQSFSRWLVLSQWLYFFVTLSEFLNSLIFFSWVHCLFQSDWLSDCLSWLNFHLFLLTRLADSRMIIAANADSLMIWIIWLLIRLLIFSEFIFNCFMILICFLRW